MERLRHEIYELLDEAISWWVGQMSSTSWGANSEVE
jgi:hypothetical protein